MQEALTGTVPVELQQVADALSLPVDKLLLKSLIVFLDDQIRFYNTERLSICRKYGVSSLEELDRLIIEGKVEEGKVLEDLQRVDFLTHRIKTLQDLLERLNARLGEA